MTLRRFLPLTCLTLLAGAPLLAQTQARLLPAQAGDLVPHRLAAGVGLPRGLDLPSERVSLAWGLDASPLGLDAGPHVAASREYWIDVTGAELRAGVPLATTAPRAVVRLNPAPGTANAEALAIDPASLVIETASGRVLNPDEAMETLVDAEQLRAAGAPFAEGTTAFRLRPGLEGAGLRLRAPELPGPRTSWVLHVFEPESPIELRLTTDRDTILGGETLVVNVGLAGATTARVASIDGFITSPGGQALPLRFRSDGNGAWTARVRPQADARPLPGLWEAHVAIHGSSEQGALRRYAKTAFAVSSPTARIAGDAELSLDRAGLQVRVPVEVASESRYEMRAVLYGTDRAGGMVPVAIAHSGAFLAPGTDELVLSWERSLLDERKVEAPFEIRDLRLVDQARMALLQRQARGYVVGE